MLVLVVPKALEAVEGYLPDVLAPVELGGCYLYRVYIPESFLDVSFDRGSIFLQYSVDIYGGADRDTVYSDAIVCKIYIRDDKVFLDRASDSMVCVIPMLWVHVTFIFC